MIFSFMMYQQYSESIKKTFYNNLPDKIKILINSADIAEKKAQKLETWHQTNSCFPDQEKDDFYKELEKNPHNTIQLSRFERFKKLILPKLDEYEQTKILAKLNAIEKKIKTLLKHVESIVKCGLDIKNMTTNVGAEHNTQYNKDQHTHWLLGKAPYTIKHDIQIEEKRKTWTYRHNGTIGHKEEYGTSLKELTKLLKECKYAQSKKYFIKIDDLYTIYEGIRNKYFLLAEPVQNLYSFVFDIYINASDFERIVDYIQKLNKKRFANLTTYCNTNGIVLQNTSLPQVEDPAFLINLIESKKLIDTIAKESINHIRESIIDTILKERFESLDDNGEDTDEQRKTIIIENFADATQIVFYKCWYLQEAKLTSKFTEEVKAAKEANTTQKVLDEMGKQNYQLIVSEKKN